MSLLACGTCGSEDVCLVDCPGMRYRFERVLGIARTGQQAGRRELANELHALLYPEEHPPDDPYFDNDHIYWDAVDVDDKAEVAEHIQLPFEWSADTIEWVSEAIAKERES